MLSVNDAKSSLDKLISKSRAHLYKPIQIAEILNKIRESKGTINPLDLESYRSKSKHWRDEITLKLVGNRSTSSARFQDNLFDQNAIPTNILEILSRENNRTNGAVEAYIYTAFSKKMSSISSSLDYCISHDKSNFQLNEFMNLFWHEPGLRRSLDKVFECVVYALFSSIIVALEVEITLSYNIDKKLILKEFEEFAKAVLNISISENIFTTEGGINRIGATNAADRGLDLWTNFGVIVQIKHLSLSEDIAEGICNSVTADRIVIVCKKAEEKIITSLLVQIGWKSRIQSIITEDKLNEWYEKALRGSYSSILGEKLLKKLHDELNKEFPSTLDNTFKNFYYSRNYHLLPFDNFWLVENQNIKIIE